MDNMLKRIKNAMEKMNKKDIVCTYEIHCNGNTTKFRTKTSNAYQIAWSIEKKNNADTYCYVCMGDIRSGTSDFNIIDGIAKLNGILV